MTSPFLSLSLLELALQTQKLVGVAKESFFSSPDVLSKEATLASSLKAFVETMKREVADWPPEYAQALVTRWDAIAQDPSFYSLLLRHPSLLSVAEQAEIFFLDHVRSWASPRGNVPPAGPGEQHQRKTIQVAQDMFSRHHVEVARRLLDWPGSTAAFLSQAGLRPVDWWLEQFADLPRMPMPLAGLIHKLDAPAFQVLLDNGLKLPSHEAGIPLLAAARDDRMVSLVASHTEDLFSLTRPFEQRQRDLVLLLQGWTSPIREHVLRTGQDGRKAFSGAADYVKEKLKAWPSKEVEATLLPWLSTEWLNNALGRPERGDEISTWICNLMGEQVSLSSERHQVKENDCEWTFEQWCAVRFLRGHGPRPVAHTQRANVQLAKTFPATLPVTDNAQRTSDLYKLLAWVDPQQPKEQTPVEHVPLDRLIPLLVDVMTGDQEPPAERRDRLHELMLSIMDSPDAQQSSAMAPLMVAYTQWAWREPKRSTNLASAGVMEWLTQPEHAALLTPGERHFVAINLMTSSIPFKPELAQAAWDVVAKAVAEQGHKQDNLTPALPSARAASGQLRASSTYQNLVRAAVLEDHLPPPVPRSKKPRF